LCATFFNIRSITYDFAIGVGRSILTTPDISRYEKPTRAQFDAREKTGAHDVAQVNPLKLLHIILRF
ncbi:MAG: hypothetical protein M0R76_11335, partial [Proteobacteria bacterium]|nr:hypothetical protein [Pseudomonadota bacterium]